MEEIYAHAQEDFPDECCGVILSDEIREFVRRTTNIQNQLHAEDPATHPRDARTAYLIDPTDLITVHREANTEQRPIKAFYHSHPNEDAYFSQKAQTDATAPWGIPNYPDAAYVVISVYNQEIKLARAYLWDDATGYFVEAPLSVKNQT